MNERNTVDKLSRLKERLDRAYAAEQSVLESQSTSNAEGEANELASLKDIQALIKDLESQISDIENGSAANVVMSWSLR